MIPSAWPTFPEMCHFTNILCKQNLSQDNNTQPRAKMDIPFLLNTVQLGSFGAEEIFIEQEKTAKALVKPTRNIPRGYREAMNGDEREEWTRDREYEEYGGI
ncbi:hypothetical protein O181_004586 [Austropuccinia psidii MF-1]|uniref:Uncharacterized protein n=1 Tax=Austropuccinia psidii MF-1 TaxID=1389203 RepID=A0A9Q3BH71_9BASI|nr:hypothetical protein [Austropuccinia psidii MF-1]